MGCRYTLTRTRTSLGVREYEDLLRVSRIHWKDPTRVSAPSSSKRQPCVNDSTPAAELTALHKCVRGFAIPAVDMWELILPKVTGIIHEDITVAVRATKTGRNLTMRFLPRTAGVSVAYIHENVNGNNPNVPFDVLYTDTKLMVADIHTKCFSDSKSWDHARKLCGVFAPGELAERVREHRTYFGT